MTALPIFTERDFCRRPRKVRSDRGKPRKCDWVTTPPRHSDPDFVPSLRLLVCREQYSLTDIGMMFGVSRERARQWCVKYNIEYPEERAAGTRGLFAVRVWDDNANRFTPVSSTVLRKAKERRDQEARRTERESMRETRQQRRRAAILGAAIALKDGLGRDPTWLEIATAVRGTIVHPKAAAVYVVHLWDTSGKPLREKYADLRTALDAVGVLARKVGGPGHVTGRLAERSDATPQSLSEVPRDGAQQ